MKTIVALAGLVFALVQIGARPADAHVHTVYVSNESDRCAWVTIYRSSGFLDNWHISPRFQPHFVKPGKEEQAVIDADEVKVLAEFRAHADCSGAQSAGVYDTYKRDDSVNFIRAHLQKYYVRID